MCLWVRVSKSFCESMLLSTCTSLFVLVRASLYVNMSECTAIGENTSECVGVSVDVGVCVGVWACLFVRVWVSLIEVVCMRVFMLLSVRVCATACEYMCEYVLACSFVIYMCKCVCNCVGAKVSV